MANLEQFVERIMGITPQYIDVFGRGMPGMAGGSVATSGAANSAADVTVELQRQITKFAQLFTKPVIDDVAIKAQAKKIEGLLMAEQTLGTLNDVQTDKLISELYDLVEQKR